MGKLKVPQGYRQQTLYASGSDGGGYIHSWVLTKWLKENPSVVGEQADFVVIKHIKTNSPSSEADRPRLMTM